MHRLPPNNSLGGTWSLSYWGHIWKQAVLGNTPCKFFTNICCFTWWVKVMAGRHSRIQSFLPHNWLIICVWCVVSSRQQTLWPEFNHFQPNCLPKHNTCTMFFSNINNVGLNLISSSAYWTWWILRRWLFITNSVYNKWEKHYLFIKMYKGLMRFHQIGIPIFWNIFLKLPNLGCSLVASHLSS